MKYAHILLLASFSTAVTAAPRQKAGTSSHHSKPAAHHSHPSTSRGHKVIHAIEKTAGFVSHVMGFFRRGDISGDEARELMSRGLEDEDILFVRDLLDGLLKERELASPSDNVEAASAIPVRGSDQHTRPLKHRRMPRESHAPRALKQLSHSDELVQVEPSQAPRRRVKSSGGSYPLDPRFLRDFELDELI